MVVRVIIDLVGLLEAVHDEDRVAARAVRVEPVTRLGGAGVDRRGLRRGDAGVAALGEGERARRDVEAVITEHRVARVAQRARDERALDVAVAVVVQLVAVLGRAVVAGVRRLAVAVRVPRVAHEVHGARGAHVGGVGVAREGHVEAVAAAQHRLGGGVPVVAVVHGPAGDRRRGEVALRVAVVVLVQLVRVLGGAVVAGVGGLRVAVGVVRVADLGLGRVDVVRVGVGRRRLVQAVRAVDHRAEAVVHRAAADRRRREVAVDVGVAVVVDLIGVVGGPVVPGVGRLAVAVGVPRVARLDLAGVHVVRIGVGRERHVQAVAAQHHAAEPVVGRAAHQRGGREVALDVGVAVVVDLVGVLGQAVVGGVGRLAVAVRVPRVAGLDPDRADVVRVAVGREQDVQAVAAVGDTAEAVAHRAAGVRRRGEVALDVGVAVLVELVSVLGHAAVARVRRLAVAVRVPRVAGLGASGAHVVGVGVCRQQDVEAVAAVDDAAEPVALGATVVRRGVVVAGHVAVGVVIDLVGVVRGPVVVGVGGLAAAVRVPGVADLGGAGVDVVRVGVGAEKDVEAVAAVGHAAVAVGGRAARQGHRREVALHVPVPVVVDLLGGLGQPVVAGVGRLAVAVRVPRVADLRRHRVDVIRVGVAREAHVQAVAAVDHAAEAVAHGAAVDGRGGQIALDVQVAVLVELVRVLRDAAVARERGLTVAVGVPGVAGLGRRRVDVVRVRVGREELVEAVTARDDLALGAHRGAVAGRVGRHHRALDVGVAVVVELADGILTRVGRGVAGLAGAETVVPAGLAVVGGVGGLVAAVRVPAVTGDGDVGLRVCGRRGLHVVRPRVARVVEAVAATDHLGLGADRRAVARRVERDHAALDVAVVVRVVLVQRVLARVGGDVARLAGAQPVVPTGLAVVVGVRRLVAAVGVPAVAGGRDVRQGVRGGGGVDAAGVGVHAGGDVEAVLAGHAGGARRREARALHEVVAVLIDLLRDVREGREHEQGLAPRGRAVGVAVGVPRVADLGLTGVHRRGHGQGDGGARRRQEAAGGLAVGARVVEAVVPTEDRLAVGVDRARRDGDLGAVQVAVEVVVPLRGVRTDERRRVAQAGVVPAVAQLGGAGVDRRQRARRGSVRRVVGIVHVGGDVRAVVRAAQGEVRLGGDGGRGPAHRARGAVEAVHEPVRVVVELVGLLGGARNAGAGGAVVVPAVADLGVAREDRRGRSRVVGGDAAAVHRVRRERCQDLGGVLQAVGHRQGARWIAHGVAIAVVIDLVQRGAGAVAQQPVAVRVQLVAQLGGAEVDGRVAVVAVAREQGAVAGGAGAVPVGVAVHLARIVGRGVAVGVESVGELGLTRVHRRVGVVAVAAADDLSREGHVGSGVADQPAVAVVVLVPGGNDRVAVVVEAVADLEHLRAHLGVRVVAVAVGGAVVVAVQVELALHAGEAGDDQRLLAVLARARHSVGVVARISRTLVVHQHVDPGPGVIVGVGDLRGARVDRGRSDAQRIVRIRGVIRAVAAARHAEHGAAEVDAVRGARDESVPVQIELVRQARRAVAEQAVAVVVVAVAELGQTQGDLVVAVVAVATGQQAHEHLGGLGRRPRGGSCGQRRPQRCSGPGHAVDERQAAQRRGDGAHQGGRGARTVDEGHGHRAAAGVLDDRLAGSRLERHGQGRQGRQGRGRLEDQLLAHRSALRGGGALGPAIQVVVGLGRVQHAVAVVVRAVAEGGFEARARRRAGVHLGGAGVDQRIRVIAVVAQGAAHRQVLARLVPGGPQVLAAAGHEADERQGPRLDGVGDQHLEAVRRGDPIEERDGDGRAGLGDRLCAAHLGDDVDRLLVGQGEAEGREQDEVVGRLQRDLELDLERHALALEVLVAVVVHLVRVGAAAAVVVLPVADLRGADLDVVVVVVAVVLTGGLPVVVVVLVASEGRGGVAVVVLAVTDLGRTGERDGPRVIAVEVSAVGRRLGAAADRGVPVARDEVRGGPAVADRERRRHARLHVGGEAIAVLVDGEPGEPVRVVGGIAVRVDLVRLGAGLADLSVQG